MPQYSPEYEAGSHRGVMPRRPPGGDLGLRRACRTGGVGLQRREMAARAVGELRLQLTNFVLN